VSFPFVLGADTLGDTEQLEQETVTPPATTGRVPSWNALGPMIAAVRAEADAARRQPPVACPNDGEPLRTGPHGELYCPFDGWRPR